MISVVLASELTVIREGMKRLLLPQADINIIAEVKHTRDLLSDEMLLEANVVLVIALTVPGSGSEYLSDLRQIYPSIRVIVVARALTLHQVSAILRMGVRGILYASGAASHLPAAIRSVSNGKLYLHEEVASMVASEYGELDKDHTHRSLTERQFAIFMKLAQGEKVSEIAIQLGISVKTVSTHKSRLMEKMGMSSHAEIIQYAVIHRLFDTGSPSQGRISH